MTPSVSLVAPSLAATHAVAAAVAAECRSGDIIALAGEMGAGKTAFAQGFGAALGVTEPITSPTFTLVHTYETADGRLHHADIYRLEQLHELDDLALGELAEDRGVVIVEWGDVVSPSLGDHLDVRLELDDADGGDGGDGGADAAEQRAPTVRRITLRPAGRTWALRWDRLVRRLSELDLGAEPDGAAC